MGVAVTLHNENTVKNTVTFLPTWIPHGFPLFSTNLNHGAPRLLAGAVCAPSPMCWAGHRCPRPKAAVCGCFSQAL